MTSNQLKDEWIRNHNITNILQGENRENRENRTYWLEKESDILYQSYITPKNNQEKNLQIISKMNPIRSNTLKDKKIILYYFSASWCPPCKKFTPMLRYIYNVARASHKYVDEIEIIFISMDKDQKSFSNYFLQHEIANNPLMPWLAFPFEYSLMKSDILLKNAKQKGIPCLMLVDNRNGNFIKNIKTDVEQTYNEMLKVRDKPELIRLVDKLCDKLLEMVSET